MHKDDTVKCSVRDNMLSETDSEETACLIQGER